MLKNIKSQYILSFIFSYTNEKIKLNLLKYNKTLQNKLNINITTYKNFARKYIIYENKEKAKIYNIDTNKIIYEGNVLKGGIKNGYGIEYDNYGGVIFIGEFLEGKRKKGKEYYENGDVKFEGEYLDQKRWNGYGYYRGYKYKYELKNGQGYVYEFYEDNKLFYEGEYLNGEKNGKGKEIEFYIGYFGYSNF